MPKLGDELLLSHLSPQQTMAWKEHRRFLAHADWAGRLMLFALADGAAVTQINAKGIVVRSWCFHATRRLRTADRVLAQLLVLQVDPGHGLGLACGDGFPYAVPLSQVEPYLAEQKLDPKKIWGYW